MAIPLLAEPGRPCYTGASEGLVHVMRVTAPEVLAAGMASFAAGLIDFDLEDLVLDQSNLVVTTDDGSFVIFESTPLPGVYAAHHFHPASVRGRAALDASRACLEFLFQSFPEIKAARGFTERGRREAVWAARQLGFRDYGDIVLKGRTCAIMLLTRRDFEGDGK